MLDKVGPPTPATGRLAGRLKEERCSPSKAARCTTAFREVFARCADLRIPAFVMTNPAGRVVDVHTDEASSAGMLRDESLRKAVARAFQERDEGLTQVPRRACASALCRCRTIWGRRWWWYRCSWLGNRNR